MKYVFIGFLLFFSISLNAMTPDEREQVRQSWLKRTEALQSDEQNADRKEEAASGPSHQGKMEADDQECLICLDEKDEKHFNILELLNSKTCYSFYIFTMITE